MANEASSIDYSKFTLQKLEEQLKRPNLSKRDQERLLDELTRRTTEELIRKTNDNSGEFVSPEEIENQLDTPKPEQVILTNQQLAKPRSTLTRILFFLTAAILSFVGIILLLLGLTNNAGTTFYGVICLGAAFWLFNSR